MRKLTSRRFQKCVTYRGSEFLNGSYCCSKSTESEIFDSSPKISGVTKKEICHNNENLVSKRIAPQDNPIGSSFYSFRASIPVIFALLFFCDADFFLKFHLTLTANNSGLKPSKLEKYHIFGILRTSAFTWSYPG